MTLNGTGTEVGVRLRTWRQRRRLSQLDLAGVAQVSARHLSFVETGRSAPSRQLVLHLAEHLDVPLRERNALLLAAGFAPLYRQTPLDAEEMLAVRAAVNKIVRGHEPFPAIVVDRDWNLVTANDAAIDIFTYEVAAELLSPPVNALRLSLHPRGLAPRVGNLNQWAEHVLARLNREIAAGAELAELADELRGYVDVDHDQRADDVAGQLFVPLVLHHRGRRLTFFSTIATFGTALDITLAELSIESFFPADAATASALTAARPVADG
jgi:transcriptional regulator with XRE-family HTH domain